MIFIIDGNNFCFRAGIVGALSDDKGTQTGVIFVTLKMLKRLVNEYSPSLVLVVWDGGKSEWRQQLYPEYKEKRGKSHVDDGVYSSIVTQMSQLYSQVFPHLPILQWRVDKTEADDLIYAAVKVFSETVDDAIFVVSTDKDMYQLLNKCSILRFADEQLYTEKDFLKEFNFPVKHWVKYRALVGDTSDEIRGVDGVGKVTAQKIFSEYGSIEAFCEANKGKKVVEKIKEGMSVFERNVEIMTLAKLPGRTKLRKKLIRTIKHTTPEFGESPLKKAFATWKMASILRDWQMWAGHFRRLEKQTERFISEFNDKR